MRRPRILHLEDDGDFGALLSRALRRAGVDAEILVVNQPETFRAAVQQGDIDLVIADGSIDGYDGLAALRDAKARRLSCPLVILSGGIPPGGVNAYLAAGAADYLLKDDLAAVARTIHRLLTAPVMSAAPVEAEAREDAALRLAAAVKRLSQAATLAEVASIATPPARRICGADRATFAVRAGDLCRHLCEDGISPAVSRSIDHPLVETISGIAIWENRPVLIEDIQTHGGGADLLGHESGMRSAAAIPVGRGFPGAAIAVYWQETHRASARELELLTALADVVALVLDRMTSSPANPARVGDAEPATSASEWEQLARLIAHDLRNPLWQIRGFAELLIEDHTPAGADEGPSSLEHLIQAADELARVIDWVVELAHVSGARLSPRTVDLTAAARDVMALLSSSGAGGAFQWRVGEGLRATTDPLLVRTLLEKLISNIVRSSSGGADTRIELDRAEDADDRTTFFVRQSPITVDPDQKAPLGGAHRRAIAAPRLATIRRILHRLGGELVVEEAPSGATFYFTLPAAR